MHIEVGVVQKAHWCVRDDSSPLAWRLHEIYFFLVLLILPGTFMVIAYGGIAREICRCMNERAYLVADGGGIAATAAVTQAQGGDIAIPGGYAIP